MEDGDIFTVFLVALAIGGWIGSCAEDVHTRDADEEVGARGQECYANNTCDGTLVCYRLDADETRCEKAITPVRPRRD